MSPITSWVQHIPECWITCAGCVYSLTRGRWVYSLPQGGEVSEGSLNWSGETRLDFCRFKCQRSVPEYSELIDYILRELIIICIQFKKSSILTTCIIYSILTCIMYSILTLCIMNSMLTTCIMYVYICEPLSCTAPDRGRGGSRRYFGFLSEKNAKTLPRKCFCVFLGVKR